MSNTVYNKVTVNGTTYIDLSQDTVADASHIRQGYVGHLNDGTQVTGSYQGSGGSSWTLLKSQEFSVNTTNTSNASVGTVDIDLSDAQDKNIIIVAHIRDKAGKRAGYFYGSDAFFLNYPAANNDTGYVSSKPMAIFNYTSQSQYSAATGAYGVYPRYLYQTSSTHYVQIYSRYNSSYGTINGTFKVDIYKLTPPTGMTLFG